MTKKSLKLEAFSRGPEEKAPALRRSAFIPAILYGSGVKNKSLKMEKSRFEQVFAVAGESSLVDLSIDGAEPTKIIVKSFQRDVVKDNITHVDFYAVDMKKKIITEIPLFFEGVSKAVKELGGLFSRNIDHIQVECLPDDLVHEIKIDISGLDNIGDSIKLKDVKLPHGMQATASQELMVVSIIEPAKEEVVEAAPAAVEAAAVAAGEKKEEPAKEEKEKKEKKEKK